MFARYLAAVVIILVAGLALLPIAARSQSDDAADGTDSAALIGLARAAVVSEVTGKALPPFPESARGKAMGVFVTIERAGQVIGCRGELTPRGSTLGAEIVRAARAAAEHDPRYRPLTSADLAAFQVTVTLIDRLEPMRPAEIGTLTPDQGLVLTQGERAGVVLPWEGKDAAVRLRWAYRKAGVAEGASCLLRRMFARRYRG